MLPVRMGSAPVAVAGCASAGISLVSTPLTNGAHAAHETAVYDLALTNQDSGACTPRPILFKSGPDLPGFTRFVDPPAVLLEPGATAHIALSLTSSSEVVAGTYAYSFTLLDPQNTSSLAGQVDYTLSPAPACFVRPSRELFVTDLSVVEDPLRTSSAVASDPRVGAWTFGRLLERAAPSRERAAQLAESLFDSWLGDSEVNGFVVAARPNIEPFLLRSWPRSDSGHLDLSRAPLRLLAIVNRLDLRGAINGQAGQARFVFGVVDAAGFANPFTVILEYRLPASTEAGARAWAQAWHRLGELPFPSEEYNAALQALTDRFSARDADPHGVNGSALVTVRTDEVALEAPWELRQFRLSASDGLLHLAPVDMTPDIRFLGSQTLADFINRHEAQISSGTLRVPLELAGQPFRAGSALNTLEPWVAPGVVAATRRAFGLGTCNGCHAIPETGTEFVHVKPRDLGSSSVLSGFLTGASVRDPLTGEARVFNDLARRKDDLEKLTCACDGHPCPDHKAGEYRVH